MKICFATYESVMLLKGGPRTQILQTKRYLEKYGLEVSLFNASQELQKQNIDFVHLFGANIGTYHFAREIHKLGIPMIVTPIFFSKRPASVISSVLKIDFMIKKIMRGFWTDFGMVAEICSWAKKIIPNTSEEASLITKGLGIPPERIKVVHNGVEERFYSADPMLFKKRYGFDNFILNVGHIGPERKNVLRLIKALEKIECQAVIIGRIENNEYGNRCLTAAKQNPRLLIIDNIPHDSEILASAYAACDVFVLPSYFETPGIAALEAAIAGAKIVITRYGGTDEYFGPEAEYVDPRSVKSIQNGILKSLSQKRSNQLREKVKKEFLWENIAKEIADIYNVEFHQRFP
jgi:glycosyltransferase involved in cell wall biosynthesis